MKKLFLFLFSAFIFSTSVSAQVLVPLTVSIEEDEQPGGPGNPKTPMTAPKVYIDDICYHNFDGRFKNQSMRGWYSCC